MTEEKINQKRNLSMRLDTVASLVTPGLTVADVGCDHGWVPIFLVEQGIAPKAFAMDVRKGPLSIAEEHVREAGLETSITLRLSDGLTALSAGEADCIIIAGMGGPLIRRILTEGEMVAKSAKELILSPHSEWAECRRFFAEQGYETLTEQMVEEDGKYYLIVKLRPNTQSDTSAVCGECFKAEPDSSLQPDKEKNDSALALEYGASLLKQKDPVLKEYLLKEQNTLMLLLEKLGAEDDSQSGEKAERSRSAQRRAEIQEQLERNRLALERYQTENS